MRVVSGIAQRRDDEVGLDGGRVGEEGEEHRAAGVGEMEAEVVGSGFGHEGERL